jgi:hypothetical protein
MPSDMLMMEKMAICPQRQGKLSEMLIYLIK